MVVPVSATARSRTSSAASAESIRFAAIGDLHCSRESRGSLRDLFAEAAKSADALLLCGDLTDYGLAEEARILVEELSAAASIPIVAVLGNHDFESGLEQSEEIDIIIDNQHPRLLACPCVLLHPCGYGSGDRWVTSTIGPSAPFEPHGGSKPA